MNRVFNYAENPGRRCGARTARRYEVHIVLIHDVRDPVADATATGCTADYSGLAFPGRYPPNHWYDALVAAMNRATIEALKFLRITGWHSKFNPGDVKMLGRRKGERSNEYPV